LQMNQVQEENGVSDLTRFDEIASVGAGETIEEGVCRALQKHLMNVRLKSYETHTPSISLVKLNDVGDERCRYYINALTTMQGAPTFGLGEDVLGFPTVWLNTNDRWYDAVDLNITRALRRVLMVALLDAQNKADSFAGKAHNVSSIDIKEVKLDDISIPACDPFQHGEMWQTAAKQLNDIQKRLLVFDITPEPFLKEKLAGVYGIFLREEAYE